MRLMGYILAASGVAWGAITISAGVFPAPPSDAWAQGAFSVGENNREQAVYERRSEEHRERSYAAEVDRARRFRGTLDRMGESALKNLERSMSGRKNSWNETYEGFDQMNEINMERSQER